MTRRDRSRRRRGRRPDRRRADRGRRARGRRGPGADRGERRVPQRPLGARQRELGPCRSRCCSGTKARASSSGSAHGVAGLRIGDRVVLSWAVPCGRCRRAGAASPGAARTRGPNRHGSDGPGRRPARRASWRAARSPPEPSCTRAQAIPLPDGDPARPGVPARLRRLDRGGGGDPDGEGLAGCERRRDRPRRHRSRGYAGGEDRGRRAPDRDRHRAEEARVGHSVRCDGRRRCLGGRPGRSGA